MVANIPGAPQEPGKEKEESRRRGAEEQREEERRRGAEGGREHEKNPTNFFHRFLLPLL